MQRIVLNGIFEKHNEDHDAYNTPQHWQGRVVPSVLRRDTNLPPPISAVSLFTLSGNAKQPLPLTRRSNVQLFMRLKTTPSNGIM